MKMPNNQFLMTNKILNDKCEKSRSLVLEKVV